MAQKKRFTFAAAKEKIKELEAELEAAKLDATDNIYSSVEKKWIYFYKYSALTFYGILLGILLSKLF